MGKKGFVERVKEHFKDVTSLKKSPHSIAGGFAIGTFVALLPTFGLGVFIGILVLLFFKKISKISMMLAFVVWNPLILASVYPVSYIIGNTILSDSSAQSHGISILEKLFTSSKSFLLGSVILATIVAVIGYLLILILASHYQKIKLKKQSLEEIKSRDRFK